MKRFIIFLIMILCTTVAQAQTTVVVGQLAADVTAPEVSTVTIGTDGATVTIVFSETVVTTDYDNGDFNLDATVTGADISLNSIAGTGNTRTFTSATVIKYHDTVNADYVGSANEIEDAAGNDLAGTVTNIAVTNNTAYTFPYNGVFEDCAPDDADPMTGWTDLNGGMGAASGVCVPVTGDDLVNYDTVYGPDMEAYVTITTLPAEGTFVRVAIGSYSIKFDRVTGASNDTLSLFKVESGSGYWDTEIGSHATQEVSAGDSIGVSKVGTSIKAWYKSGAGSWVEKVSATDSEFNTTDNIFLEVVTVGTDTRFDNIGGGTIP